MSLKGEWSNVKTGLEKKAGHFRIAFGCEFGLWVGLRRFKTWINVDL
jgi:hypothetical protein